MNGDGGAPPQVIRRTDGSFHILNVHLDDLSALQRLAIAIQVIPQVRLMLEATGEFRASVPIHTGWSKTIGSYDLIYKGAAEAAGVKWLRVRKTAPRLLKRPDVQQRLLDGEMASFHDVERALGYKIRVRLDEGRESSAMLKSSYYGKGDKFIEATEPLVRYLDAWGNKGFLFTHIAPREAQRRVTRIEQLLEGLSKTREDLAMRSHVASYAAPQEKRKEKR